VRGLSRGAGGHGWEQGLEVLPRGCACPSLAAWLCCPGPSLLLLVVLSSGMVPPPLTLLGQQPGDRSLSSSAWSWCHEQGCTAAGWAAAHGRSCLSMPRRAMLCHAMPSHQPGMGTQGQRLCPRQVPGGCSSPPQRFVGAVVVRRHPHS